MIISIQSIPGGGKTTFKRTLPAHGYLCVETDDDKDLFPDDKEQLTHAFIRAKRLEEENPSRCVILLTSLWMEKLGYAPDLIVRPFRDTWVTGIESGRPDLLKIGWNTLNEWYDSYDALQENTSFIQLIEGEYLDTLLPVLKDLREERESDRTLFTASNKSVSEITSNYAVVPEVDEEIVQAALESMWPGSNFSLTDVSAADIVFARKGDFDYPPYKFLCFYDTPSKAPYAMASLLKSGKLILPTREGVLNLLAQMDERERKLKKLKASKARKVLPNEAPQKELITASFRADARLLHPPALERFAPELKDRLDRRCASNLTRFIEHYQPLSTRVDQHSSIYGDLIRSGTEHAARVAAVAEKIEKEGFAASAVDMSYSQLGVGMTFFGGENRIAAGLATPPERYNDHVRYWTEKMMYGLACEYKDDPDGFQRKTTRVSVKTFTFQGWPTVTTSHGVMKTLFQAMCDSPEGIFLFEGLESLVVVGFRRQDSGGKRRVSFQISGEGIVSRTRVLDCDDLEGGVFHLSKDVFGARVRPVANVSSPLNIVLMASTSFLSDYKTKDVKQSLQVTMDTARNLVPGTSDFRAFMKEYWSYDWFRELKVPSRFSDFDSFHDHCVEVGQYTCAGDIASFDGSTIWDMVSVYCEHMYSGRVYKLVEKLWRSDIIGTYVSKDGTQLYYYINNKDEGTFTLAEYLLSGLGLTSIAGKIMVSSLVTHLIGLCYPEVEPLLFQDLKADEYTFTSLLLADAGDDHAPMFLAVYLATGILPQDVKKKYKEEMEKVDIYDVDEEDPPICAGVLFHTEEDGKIINISLSPQRMIGNTLAPERTKTALGLLSSVQIYVDSAKGTKYEETMVNLAEIILFDVYGFDDWDHVQAAADEDEVWILEDAQEGAIQDLIAAELGVKPSELDWMYSVNELLDMGIDEELLNKWKEPLPTELTMDPFRFFNEKTIKDLASGIHTR